MDQQPLEQTYIDNDETAVSRKQDHIELAFQSQVSLTALDERFYYEPLLAGHPNAGDEHSFEFLGKTMRAPLWAVSYTHLTLPTTPYV